MSTSLMDFQRRVAAAVMEPLTKNETMRKKRRDGVAMDSEAAAFVKPNDRLTSFERLEIYNRQYWFRLYSSMEDDFPGLQAVLGRKLFDRVSRAYLDAHPSTSFTLRDLGQHLHSWLKQNEEITGSLSQLAQDVVQLEWAHIEAFDAASEVVPAQDFYASLTDDTRLALQPNVRLLSLAYPVDELLLALHRDDQIGAASSNSATISPRGRSVRHIAKFPHAQIWLAVHRQEFTVYYKRLKLEEFRMLSAIQGGATLAKVFEAAFEDSDMEMAERATLLEESFYQWAALGWLLPA